MLLTLSFPLFSQSVRINEFMASNKQIISDEDGDFSDWIEIYNPSSTTVNLSDWSLTDKENDSRLWVFPDITIQSDSYIIVFASGKDRTGLTGDLHTNFKLSKSGEYFALFNPHGIPATVFDPAYPQQCTDVSYACYDGEFVYTSTSTPGAENRKEDYSEFLGPPIFSAPAGFYAEAFELILSHPDPDVTFIYSLDGSEPDPENFGKKYYTYRPEYPNDYNAALRLRYNSYESFVYNEPILIYNRSSEADDLTHICTTSESDPNYYFPSSPVRKGIIIKAIAIKQGVKPSQTSTNSYFVNNQGINPHSLPVISIGIQEDLLFNYDTGIYVAGELFDVWRKANPDAFHGGAAPANYMKRGPETECLAHFELFEKNSNRVSLQQNIGLRLHGGLSRRNKIKSLRLYARSEYGKSTFDYPFFPEIHTSSFKRIILRNSGNDMNTTHFRDAALQKIVSHLSFDTQKYQPSILYLNGEYWGIHNIRERYDKYYLSRVYGVGEDNIDLLDRVTAEVVEGDNSHYESIRNFIGNSDLTSVQSYEYIKTKIDIVNYIDYHISEIYIGNKDWPTKNILYWRTRTDQYEPEAPYGHDGRWRWMMFDVDAAFGMYYDYMDDTFENAYMNSDFLSKLLAYCPFFKKDFIIRFADLMNTTFMPSRVKNIINELKHGIEPEMLEHLKRYGKPKWDNSLAGWYKNVDVMIDYADKRPEYQRYHIRKLLRLGSDIILTVDVSDSEAGFIHVNTIDIIPSTPGVAGDPYPWTGIYYKDIPLKIRATSKQGYIFTGWTDPELPQQAEITIIPSGNCMLQAVFEPVIVPESIVINEIFYFSSSSGDWVELYNRGDEAVDLSGWNVHDSGNNNAYQIPENIVLLPEGFLVIARDTAAFRAVHPDIPVLGPLDFGFSSSGERLVLLIPEGVTADEVDYKNEQPWPEITDQYFGSLALISPELDNGLPQSWQLSLGGGTPGAPNSFQVLDPEPFIVADSEYCLNNWLADEPDCSYPPNTKFWQSDTTDPGLSYPLNYLYSIPHNDYIAEDTLTTGYPYNNTRRSRINGLNDEGFSFINTGCGRDLGGAVLALDTRNINNLYLSFLAGTVIPNSRIYAIRLQYRIGKSGDFADLLDESGNPIEYIKNETAGHTQQFGPIQLLADLIDEPYVQLIWRYYHISGTSGKRAELRLDDIWLGTNMPDTDVDDAGLYLASEQIVLHQNHPNPFNSETAIGYILSQPDHVTLTVYNIMGREVCKLVDEKKQAGKHVAVWDGTDNKGNNVMSGLYIYTLKTGVLSETRRMVIVN